MQCLVNVLLLLPCHYVLGIDDIGLGFLTLEFYLFFALVVFGILALGPTLSFLGLIETFSFMDIKITIYLS